MPSYKDPSFQDRSSQAAEAKQRALDKLRQKPPMDEAVVAERRAARERREAAEAERLKNRPKLQTEAERKAARDARYAARKARQ